MSVLDDLKAPGDKRVRLVDCPPGLFWFMKTLGFRSEYSTETPANRAQPDAYIVSSGEYFWGGATTSADRDDLMVLPIDGTDILIRTTGESEP